MQPAPNRNAQSALVWHLHPAIMHWPGLKLAPKVLWVKLWNDAGCRRGTITTASGYLATELGENDRRIREWLKLLEEIGAIATIDKHRAGERVLEVRSPEELACGRVVKHDGQRELFDPDDAGPPETPEAATETIPFPHRKRCPAPEKVPKAAPDSGGEASTQRERGNPKDVVVKDVRRLRSSTSDDQTNAEWDGVVEDAKRVASKLWSHRDWQQFPLSREDRSLLLKACRLAATVLSEHWLSDSVQAVVETKPSKPAGYFHATLANRYCYPDHQGRLTDEQCREARKAFNRLLAGVEVPKEFLSPRPKESNE